MSVVVRIEICEDGKHTMAVTQNLHSCALDTQLNAWVKAREMLTAAIKAVRAADREIAAVRLKGLCPWCFEPEGSARCQVSHP